MRRSLKLDAGLLNREPAEMLEDCAELILGVGVSDMKSCGCIAAFVDGWRKDQREGCCKSGSDEGLCEHFSCWRQGRQSRTTLQWKEGGLRDVAHVRVAGEDESTLASRLRTVLKLWSNDEGFCFRTFVHIFTLQEVPHYSNALHFCVVKCCIFRTISHCLIPTL